jgi:glycosyltransferase involved in cell wall biosynthesis
MRPLEFLYATLFPASPPTFGAQRRIEGLMKALARHHRVSAVSLLGPEFDGAEAERAMRAYCSEVVLVPAPALGGSQKRLLQLRSLLSTRSHYSLAFGIPAFRRALLSAIRRRRPDVLMLEAPFLWFPGLRHGAPGGATPRIVFDEHNIEYDLARQSGSAGEGPLRRLFTAVNWRKMKREEVNTWHLADGVAFTSADDEARARRIHPGLRAAVVPNAVDVDHFRPDPALPRPDGKTLLFFGTLNYFPNQDGVRHLLRDVWPILERAHPEARIKIVGPHPTPEVLAQRGPRIEVTGLVDDLRPHLASAAAVVVPLRVGGGTRFKIIEAMSMGKAVVSTTIGAEGIGAEPEREILIADDAPAFAAACARVLDEAGLAGRLGAAGRALVEARYSWTAAGAVLERFVGDIVEGPPGVATDRARAALPST